MADPRVVAARLRAAGCIAADEEARELVETAPADSVLERWIARREQGEPLAWIIGHVRFCGLALRVTRGVYVPRPQTEDLARRAAALLPPGGTAADLCTGTGAVAAYLKHAVPSARVVGVDRDPKAVACARENGVVALEADVEDEFAEPQTFDLVTAVPPYVPTAELRTLAADVQRWEPRGALDGGPDGLDTARRIVAAAGRLLKPAGWLVVELGGDQDEQLAPALEAAGFGAIEPWYDADDSLRGLTAGR